MPRLTDEELKWLKECYRLALINEEVWTRDDQKSWEEMCDAVPGIIREAEGKQGISPDPRVYTRNTVEQPIQAYADKVLEVATSITAALMSATNDQGDWSHDEEKAVKIGISTAMELITAANEAAMKREETK